MSEVVWMLSELWVSSITSAPPRIQVSTLMLTPYSGQTRSFQKSWFQLRFLAIAFASPGSVESALAVSF